MTISKVSATLDMRIINIHSLAGELISGEVHSLNIVLMKIAAGIEGQRFDNKRWKF